MCLLMDLKLKLFHGADSTKLKIKTKNLTNKNLKL